MNVSLILRTVKYLKPTQVFYQVKNRLIKPSYVALKAPDNGSQVSRLETEPIPKNNCVEGERFSFLNLDHEFAGWNFTENGMLWAYNQNYFDWINQEGSTKEEGCAWIDRFINELPSNKIGLDSYPIALRSINWIKFFCHYPDCATKPRTDSLYSQLKHLEKKLEYHILGNHLLEDAYALYIGASFFHDNRLLKKAENLLLSQSKEQILPDGAHYEQSPMYHCILLDRLLDCINIRKTDVLMSYAKKMLGHLAAIVWSDGTIPLMNDSAEDIAPTPQQIFNYAECLGLYWEEIHMKECGYRKMQFGTIEAVVDVGNITATYQPGHTHADTFNYELRINGIPIVADTGISTYNKTERRQYERSTKAHNTISVDGKDSSEVWGGFRVGRRCEVSILSENKNRITASHNGFGKICSRTFSIDKGEFEVEDKYEGEAISYIHLASGVDSSRVTIEGAESVDVLDTKYSTKYNRFIGGKTIAIHFSGSCKYTIK